MTTPAEHVHVEESSGSVVETAAAAPGDTAMIEDRGATEGHLLPSGAAGRAGPDCSDQELVAGIHSRVSEYVGQPDLAREFGQVAGAERRLLNEGRIEEADLLAIYSAVSGLRTADDEDLTDLERFPEVTFDFLAHHQCLPVTWDEQDTLLALTVPYDTGRISMQWYAFFGRRAMFVLARQPLIERHLTALYDVRQDEGLLADGDANEQTLRDLAREAPIVRLVNDMFNRAVEMGASDIHVEPQEDTLAIRYRIDGVLQTVQTPPVQQYSAIASRLKLLAGMNIAERRLPQDGRIDLNVGQIQIDMRVSTVPSMHGESIVMRLLQKDGAIFDLDKVGMSAAMCMEFERLFSMPHGMILVVGPTGSGKSTTLYCVMKQLNAETRKIITVEDPVEYQLPGLTQIQVRASIGLTFAAGLRSIVRQDPDVILVGEIRDRETAEIAIHAALTGHLVLSTLHTNDAAGAISRLQDMGIESFLLSSSLLGIVSQRLVRRICPECDGKGHVEGDTSGRRCRNCLGSGYRGRVGIFEMLLVCDDIRHAINEHADSNEIGAIARRHGMRTLREDGELKAGQGLTTMAEVTRVCQLDVGSPSTE